MNTIEAVSALLNLSTNFSAQVDISQATEILTLFRPYNGIPSAIHELPAAIARAIGPTAFGNGNPNDGKHGNIKLRLGNEGSLCIYVETNTYYRRHDTAARISRQLSLIGTAFRADEISVETKPYTLMGAGVEIITARLWWD